MSTEVIANRNIVIVVSLRLAALLHPRSYALAQLDSQAADVR
jgi:hypothetical protein